MSTDTLTFLLSCAEQHSTDPRWLAYCAVVLDCGGTVAAAWQSWTEEG